ncbi:MAG TPA: FAD-binding oxidoreductase, partial [Prosthecobacter sp.]|nr:FAD-binding oxidoreductase [Prosthecobacter sp.]
MASLADQLVSLLGPDRVSVTQADLATHSTDKWFASNAPDVVVHAQSTEDVSKTLRFANEHKIPVTPQGARVGYVGGAVPLKGGIALSVTRMNKIKEIALEDGVAVVEPGVITG